MHCWYEKETSYAIFAIVLLLILGAVYFSVRGILAMKQIQLKLTDELEFGRSSLVSKKKSNVDYIIRTLWIYPITTAILWILFFIFQNLIFLLLKIMLILIFKHKIKKYQLLKHK